jgi:hypothetical protein
MKPGSYTLHELFASRDLEQLVVPEIQRDYVWGPKQLTLLLKDLRQAAIHWTQAQQLPAIAGLDAELFQAFQQYYDRQVHSHSLGFMYAYQDAAYPGKTLLIDGQQRLTSLYLLLLASALREGATSAASNHFRTFYLWQGAPKIDYRVREAARTFAQQFVSFLLAGGHADQTKQQYWYFAEYDDDLTISSLLSNYTFLARELAQPDCQPLCYQYLRDYVQVEYFDTNLSSQGEELYLSLNSTGHPTEDNENIRALLLEQELVADRPHWGRRWEYWQQFFWKQRGDNPNADLGFDEFLRWVWLICLVENGKGDMAERLAESRLSVWELAEDAAARMADVDRLFQAVGHLYDTLPHASLFFGKDWLAGGNLVRDQRQQLAPLPLFRLLVTLRFCLSRPAELRPSAAMLQRLARYFYNVSRIKGHFGTRPAGHLPPALRLVHRLADLAEDVNCLLDLPEAAAEVKVILLPDEELWKLRQYRTPPEGFTREQVETMLWELEDDEWNEGQIGHLFAEIKANIPLLPHRLTTVCSAYTALFPAAKTAAATRANNQRLLQSLLLDYGAYWQTATPEYYTNYSFREWHATVRTAAFKQFFAEFTAVPGTLLTDFYLERRQAYFSGRTIEQLRTVRVVREQLFILAALFYSLPQTSLFSVGIWKYGHYIGYKNRELDQNLYPFFTEDFCFINAERYPYKDSSVMSIVDHLAKQAGPDLNRGVELLLTKLLAEVNQPLTP